MSLAEMKIEVINKITNLKNETVLQEVFSLLKEANETEMPSFDLSRNYAAIKEQYGDVLQKLAQ